MTTNWPTEIARLNHWKQRAAQHDLNGVLEWHLPNIAATPQQLNQVEKSLSFSLPKDFREFLSFANGWKHFLVRTDLFGTDDLLRGRGRSALSKPHIRSFLDDNAIPQSKVLAIGESDNDAATFLLLAPDYSPLPGGVIWLDSEEVDRYPSFAEFFSSMVNYNARVAQSL